MAREQVIVPQSLNKTRWVLEDCDWDEAAALARRFNLPEIVGRLLCQKGVQAHAVQEYLSPSLKHHFPDPFSMKQMEAMAGYVAEAVIEKRKMAIFGDFDVDGATSSATLCRFFRHFDIEAPIYIPDRLSEGYGPNEEALRAIREQGAEILFMLDCGTTAHDTVAAGRAMGLEIIIFDHHEAEDLLPPALFLINPKRADDRSGLDMLAACGVTFLACVAINNKLRAFGYFKDTGRAEPPLKDWIDLTALGTVCDMVPLTGANRLLVRTGFASMDQTINHGLKNLIQVSNIEGKITPYHAGFIIGPRINAGSRVFKSDLGATLLSTDDPEEALNIAWTLNDCNEKRKALQKEMERRVMQEAEDKGYVDDTVIVVADEEGHQGLSGLVAGQLKEKYGRPACVISMAENEHGEREGRGSGRSIQGVHIAKAFIEAKDEGLLLKGGGHAMAGGFSIAPDKIPAFREFMIAHVSRQLESREPQVETRIDGLLSVNAVRADLIHLLQESLGPFGQDHPEPLFMLPDVKIHMADLVGDSHIKVIISDWEGTRRIKAMAFRSHGTAMGEALLKSGAERFHLLGHLKINSWRGLENPEFHIRDAVHAREFQLRSSLIETMCA